MMVPCPKGYQTLQHPYTLSKSFLVSISFYTCFQQERLTIYFVVVVVVVVVAVVVESRSHV